MKNSLPILCVLGAMVGVGWNLDTVRKEANPTSRPAGLNAHESNAAASLLGQFRSSASAWLWLKADLYLHNGVEMRQLTDAERKAGLIPVKDSDGWHAANRDHSSLVTSVPSASRDFRGWMGDVERATSSFQEMQGHRHNDPADSLPLYRLMTWLDPQFILGWTTGAMILAGERTESTYTQAIEWLLAGLRVNPESIAIRADLARLYVARLGNIDDAIPLLEQACRLAENHDGSLAEDEESAVVDCFRWLALCYAEIGRSGDSIAIARRGLELVGEDPVLTRQLVPVSALLVPLDSESNSIQERPLNKDSKVESTHVHGPGCNHAH